jgi:hypothetical protein
MIKSVFNVEYGRFLDLTLLPPPVSTGGFCSLIIYDQVLNLGYVILGLSADTA